MNCRLVGVLQIVGLMFGIAQVSAQNAVDDWASARLPAAPQLKAVKIESAKETALLVMDFTNPSTAARIAPNTTLTRLGMITW